MADELLSCPFCGSDDLQATGTLYEWVFCKKCEAEGPCVPSNAEGAWNRRAGHAAGQSAAAERVAVLEAALQLIGRLQPCHCTSCTMMGQHARAALEGRQP